MNDCFLEEEGGGAGVNGAPQTTVPPAPTQFHDHGPGPEAGEKDETNPEDKDLNLLMRVLKKIAHCRLNHKYH